MLFLDGKQPISSLAHKLELHVRGKLWAQVVLCMLLGMLVGVLLGPDLHLVDAHRTAVITEWIALPGEVFLRLIKMILVPLVFFSIIRGLGGSNIKDLRTIGPQFLAYLLCTSTFACIVGIGLAELLDPGSYVSIPDNHAIETLNPGAMPKDIMKALPGMMVEFIPENPLAAAIEGEMLSIVIFSLLFGIALAMQSNRKIQHLLDILDDLLAVFMTIVKWAMLLTPIAVFGLIARMAALTGISVLLGMGVFVATVLLGLIVLLLFYYSIVFIWKRRNPREFASKIAGLQLLAFSTSSSAAVMPVTMKTAEEELDADPATTEIIVPLGATINMDGSAVYQSVAIIFMAQSAGMDLSIGKMVLIVLTLIASSIGSPGTPGVGVAILITVAGNLGIPTGAHGLILGVDRILDMCRTAVNVTGDITACVLFGTKKK